MIDESGLVATIGRLQCGAPTYADDVAVLGGRIHAQCNVYIVRWYCSGHRYCIHLQKSEEVQMNKDNGASQSDIMYGDEPISKVQSTVHLGVHGESSGRPDIPKKVQSDWCRRLWRIWVESRCFLSSVDTLCDRWSWSLVLHTVWCLGLGEVAAWYSEENTVIT